MAENPRRYFTPDEANVLIPELSVRLSRCGDLLRRHQDLVERADEDVVRRADLLFQAEAVRAEAEGIVNDIATQGVEIRASSLRSSTFRPCATARRCSCAGARGSRGSKPGTR